MAHRTNVIQVRDKVEPSDRTELVTDPVCGRTLARSDSRYMLFRDQGLFHFCSKECRSKFKPGSSNTSFKTEAA